MRRRSEEQIDVVQELKQEQERRAQKGRRIAKVRKESALLGIIKTPPFIKWCLRTAGGLLVLVGIVVGLYVALVAVGMALGEDACFGGMALTAIAGYHVGQSSKKEVGNGETR